MTAWNITYLAVHVLLCMGAASLYCTAPDRLQKFCVLLPIIVASLILVGVYSAALVRADEIMEWEIASVKAFAHTIGWGAMTFYILRLVFKEKLSCQNLSRRSPHFTGW